MFLLITVGLIVLAVIVDEVRRSSRPQLVERASISLTAIVVDLSNRDR